MNRESRCRRGTAWMAGVALLVPVLGLAAGNATGTAAGQGQDHAQGHDQGHDQGHGQGHDQGHGQGHGHAQGHGTAADDHPHDQVLSLDPATAPTLDLALALAPGGGLGLELSLERIHLSREQADGPHADGVGHGHLYIDGEKIGRIYERSHPLPALAPGVHRIRVGLYTNDHMAYAAGPHPVAREIVVQIPAPADRERSSRVVRAAVRIDAGEAAPRSMRVERDDLVGIDWSVTAPLELHLHGYDVGFHVTPARPISLYLFARATGRFPVAIHLADGAHGHGAPFHLEVYPR